jgi:hypothetical protein
VNLSSLKRSITQQLASDFAKSSRELDAALEKEVVFHIVRSLAAAPVETIISPDTLVRFFGDGRADLSSDLSPPHLDQLDFRNPLMLLAAAEYSGRDFFLIVPIGTDEQTGYRLHLRLQNWEWKLTEVRLPAPVAAALVQKIRETVSSARATHQNTR